MPWVYVCNPQGKTCPAYIGLATVALGAAPCPCVCLMCRRTTASFEFRQRIRKCTSNMTPAHSTRRTTPVVIMAVAAPLPLSSTARVGIGADVGVAATVL